MGNRCAAERGFTLLETLVAVTVLGFLMIGLTSGVRTGLAFWNAQTRRTAQTAELDSTTRVLRNLLTEIPTLAAGASGAAPVAIGFKGEPDRLTLVGDLPTGLGGAQRVDVTIQLNADRVVMVWTPHRHETPGGAPPAPTETELIRGVDHLQYAYWGATGPNSPPAWLAQWDSAALPELVRVSLGFAKGDVRHWPELIAAPRLWNPQS
jgi:general secretion pathway protein J